MAESEKKKLVTFNFVIKQEILDGVDQYRRQFDNPPPRAEAIRQLLKQALAANGIKVRPGN